MIEVERTIISQYSASPTLKQLVRNIDAYVDPRTNFEAFYNAVWNVDTAVGFGLDIWGKIVGVSRLLRIPGNSKIFGFKNDSFPHDWKPFNYGTFYTGSIVTQAYYLPDDTYRTLILTKALANIVATTAASINQLLRNLFPDRGRAYVLDLGGMSMVYVFEFNITPAEYAILTQSGVMPHPAGVRFSITVLGDNTFGFNEMGASVLPFNDGVFYAPPVS